MRSDPNNFHRPASKAKVLYLQGGEILRQPKRAGKCLRVVTVLNPDDFKPDAGLYKSNEDVAGFFVLAGERVTIGECEACGSPVDSNEIHRPPGLTPVHRCA